MCIFCGSFCEFSDAASASAGASDKYRFSRSDFGPVPFRPLHYDLSVLFNKSTSDGVNVVSRQTYRNETKEPLTELTLNAHDLKVDSVQVILGHAPLGPPPVGFDAVVPDFVGHVAELETLSATPTKFDYQKDERKLIVTLDTPVQVGEEVVIRTDSTCYPNDTELEGIYFDQTPPGKPQTMISQCQQYGFQRIVPCVDTMNAKTFFTTRITCLAEYENVLCNGDKVEEKDAGDGMQEVTYVNHVVNMAPYLFFIGVGTYDTHIGEVEYPNGDVFLVELLCLPGVVEKEGDARAAVNSLVESIVWTQVCTGPEKYEHAKERKEIMQLVKKRDVLKKEGKTGPEIEGVRSRLKELISVWGETGYTYPFKTYREIAMQNSNYGGMENLNNTTILSSMLTPSRWLVDEGYVYMEGVKVHEFYHNINGSQATGETPFEIWLNEAVTVHVQREREDAIFGHDYMRLGQVMYAQQPGSGPLALDRAPSSMAVEPMGFNTTHELISAMTYSKAPEFVRMTQSIIGKDNFVKALFDYHKKFAFSNATSWQWVEEMAVYQPEGVDIVKMAKGWLQRTGYPTLVVEAENWEGGEGKIKVRQTGFEDKKVEKERYPWVIPIKWAAVKDGKVVAEGLEILQTTSGEIKISGAGAVDFVSIACDWSFYGDVKNEAQTAFQTLLQAKSDPDTVNRFLAFQSILDDEKCRLVEALRSGCADGLVDVSDEFVDLYGAILNDEKLAVSTKGRFLAISSSCPSRPELSHLYNHLSQARTAVLQAVYKKHSATLKKVYTELNAGSCLENRTLKQAIFSAIRSGIAVQPVIGGGVIDVEMGEKEAYEMVAPLLNAKDMSDRSFALKAAIELGRTDAMVKARKEWTEHTIGCERYISCIARVDSDKSPEYIRTLIKEPFFKMALAGHARTVSRAWCANQKRALLTKDGLKLTKELFWAVGSVNQMSAYGFISAFAQTMKFDASVRDVLIQTVKDMRDGLDEKKQESLYNQLTRVISSFVVE